MEASGVSAEGRYVVLQKDNVGLAEGDWQLHLAEFMAFGEQTDKITGYTYQIRSDRILIPIRQHCQRSLTNIQNSKQLLGQF